MAPSGGASAANDALQAAPRRQGKASKNGSIFARAQVCKDSCRYCTPRPCDVAVDHDDHTCYDCEQRLLNPDGDPGAPWRPPLLPGYATSGATGVPSRGAAFETHMIFTFV